AELIRQRDRTRDTPIIFLTAADSSLAMRGYAVGAVDYIMKPAVPDFVRSKVSVFVELAKKNDQLTRQAVLLRAREAEARELADARAELVADLERKNRELESFSYAVSHDLRAPLRRVDSFSRALLESAEGRLDDDGVRFARRIREASGQMQELIDALLHLSRVTRAELRRIPVDLSEVALQTAAELRASEPERPIELSIRPAMVADGDPRLLRVLFTNLMSNAFKFTAGRVPAKIDVGLQRRDGETVYYLRDNGAGFDMSYVNRLFGPFQRLHSAEAFPGTGIGLATVQRIVHRHDGRIWAEGTPGQGATFWFTLERTRNGR
ncbi:MAG: ATP-binding protein, partial [Gemmatimonadota bacterium]|nr:ATP-binding protein [Gemmatimonadota bacterium]